MPGDSVRPGAATTESDLRRAYVGAEETELERRGDVFGETGLELVLIQENAGELIVLIRECISSVKQRTILVEPLFNEKAYKEIAVELRQTLFVGALLIGSVSAIAQGANEQADPLDIRFHAPKSFYLRAVRRGQVRTRADEEQAADPDITR